MQTELWIEVHNDKFPCTCKKWPVLKKDNVQTQSRIFLLFELDDEYKTIKTKRQWLQKYVLGCHFSVKSRHPCLCVFCRGENILLFLVQTVGRQLVEQRQYRPSRVRSTTGPSTRKHVNTAELGHYFLRCLQM